MTLHRPLRFEHTPAWAALRQAFASHGQAFDLRAAFATDAQRFNHFSQQAPHVFADLSKNLIDGPTEALLLDLARQRGLEQQRDALFSGALVNSTEQCAAMHWLLCMPDSFKLNTPQTQQGQAQPAINLVSQEWPEVQHSRAAMLAYAERVRSNPLITDVVNIGIGGSDLGPQMAVLALAADVLPGQRLHFVSNVDGHALDEVLRQVQPAHTLFLIASKTFTTAETMANAQSARHWFTAQGGRDIAAHFVGLTTNIAAAQAWGIETTFGFWDWVGGRYSLCSAVGLALAIAIGAENFQAFLGGAHAMDEHFRTAPLESNLPVRLGLLDVWYRNFHGFSSRCVAPYEHALRRFPAYLQQLEMESNGKRVDLAGQTLPYATSPVIWGEPGTNGQHAFFQMLHQGSDVTPLELIAVREARHPLSGHHDLLLANALAQAQALMVGKADADNAHQHFPGNRPSTFLLLERLDPATLGALIALYEHRVFVSGTLWGINSFDQWGVELGKVLAQDIAPRLRTGDVAGLDASTAGLLARLR